MSDKKVRSCVGAVFGAVKDFTLVGFAVAWLISMFGAETATWEGALVEVARWVGTTMIAASVLLIVVTGLINLLGAEE